MTGTVNRSNKNVIALLDKPWKISAYYVTRLVQNKRIRERVYDCVGIRKNSILNSPRVVDRIVNLFVFMLNDKLDQLTFGNVMRYHEN